MGTDQVGGCFVTVFDLVSSALPVRAWSSSSTLLPDGNDPPGPEPPQRLAAAGEAGRGGIVAEWWAQSVAHHRLNVIALDAPVLIRSAELPPVHRDPADRIIIATALAHRVPVVTSDRRFAEYGVETML